MPKAGEPAMPIVRMRSKLHRILKLSPSEWKYFATAIFELSRARISVATLPTRELFTRFQADVPPVGTATLPQPPREIITRIAWAIAAGARRVPWRADCLVQAVAADRWLRQHGLVPEFYLGVSKDGPDHFQAHAWIRCGDVTVTGGPHDDFSPLIAPER